MKTLEHFFNASHQRALCIDRQSKIQELMKPVYSRKFKEKNRKRLFLNTQFVTTISQIKINNKKSQPQSGDHRVKRSKSDIFLKRKNKEEENQNSKTQLLMDSMIVSKVDYAKDSPKPLSISKNNLLKVFERVTSRASSSPLLNAKIFYENAGRNRNRNLKKMIGNNVLNLNSQSQNVSPRAEYKKYQAQSFKIIQLLKKEDLQQSIINQIGELRRKRNSLGHESKPGEASKLVPKNSLFFANYLKQKQKHHQVDKSPHINNIKNATQNIKIQQNPDLRKTLMNKVNQKNQFRDKLETEKHEKVNEIFNSMKIQPW